MLGTRAAIAGLDLATHLATTSPAPAGNPRALISLLSLIVLAASLGLLGIGLAIILILRRRKWSKTAAEARASKRPNRPDAWAESARRLQLPPDDHGADDDTRDIDPDDLSPHDILPGGDGDDDGGKNRGDRTNGGGPRNRPRGGPYG